MPVVIVREPIMFIMSSPIYYTAHAKDLCLKCDCSIRIYHNICDQHMYIIILIALRWIYIICKLHNIYIVNVTMLDIELRIRIKTSHILYDDC